MGTSLWFMFVICPVPSNLAPGFIDEKRGQSCRVPRHCYDRLLKKLDLMTNFQFYSLLSSLYHYLAAVVVVILAS